MPGMHSPSGSNGVGNAIRVHLVSLLTPLAGHVQVLHPSGAVHDKGGQHFSVLLSTFRARNPQVRLCQATKNP